MPPTFAIPLPSHGTSTGANPGIASEQREARCQFQQRASAAPQQRPWASKAGKNVAAFRALKFFWLLWGLRLRHASRLVWTALQNTHKIFKFVEGALLLLKPRRLMSPEAGHAGRTTQEQGLTSLLVRRCFGVGLRRYVAFGILWALLVSFQVPPRSILCLQLGHVASSAEYLNYGFACASCCRPASIAPSYSLANRLFSLRPAE